MCGPKDWLTSTNLNDDHRKSQWVAQKCQCLFQCIHISATISCHLPLTDDSSFNFVYWLTFFFSHIPFPHSPALQMRVRVLQLVNWEVKVTAAIKIGSPGGLSKRKGYQFLYVILRNVGYRPRIRISCGSRVVGMMMDDWRALMRHPQLH